MLVLRGNWRLCFEQDSPPGSTENLKSVENKTAKVASPVDDNKDLQTGASYRQPLITSSPSADDEATRPTSTPRKDSDLTSPVAVAADDNVDDDVPNTADMTTSLIGKASSHVSLDSYDRTKNPFFAH